MPPRTPSEYELPSDRDLVLQQLMHNMSELTKEVRAVGMSVNEVKLELVAGSGRMNQLEERIDNNKKALEDQIDGVRKAVNNRVDGIEERMDRHDSEASAARGRWSGILPQVIAGVLTAIFSAAAIGGIIYANTPDAPKQAQGDTNP